MKKFYSFLLFACYIQQVCAQNANQTLSNLKAPTAINAGLFPNADNNLSIGSAAKSWKDIYLDGSLYLGGARFIAYKTGTGIQNTAIGSAVLNANTTGTGNSGVGFNALFFNTTGSNNTAIGSYALYVNKGGSYNTANGAASLYSNTTGYDNTATGFRSLWANTTGNYNVANGSWSLSSNTTGNNNTATGKESLASNTIGSENTANGYQALHYNLNGYYNTATGSGALYSNNGWYNTATGYKALYSNTTGEYNTAHGFNALYYNNIGERNTANGVSALFNNLSGSDNSANGYHALYSNTTGDGNTANSSQALYSNTTGSDNTANGFETLYHNTTGNDNTANGYNALYYNTTGAQNTANGLDALYRNETGKNNTANGYSALYFNTTGYRNTANGYQALSTNSTGNNLTAIGAYADVSVNGLTNATALGYNAIVTASNKVRVGSTAVTSIGGQVGWTTFSDGRYKRNIKENVQGLVFINSLRPVTYTVDIQILDNYFNKGRKTDSIPKENEMLNQATDEASKIVQTGFVAQEVEAAAKKLNYDFNGVDKPKTKDGLYGLRYDEFVVPLVKAVQELSKMNDAKDGKIDSLQQQNKNQQKINADLQKQMNDLKNIVLQIQQTQQQCSPCNAAATGSVQQYNMAITDAAVLEQNVPNPFTNATTIAYSLPAKFSSAKIVITDRNGKQLKQLNITAVGKGTVHVDASTLASGAYNYSLYVDGRLVASKQMILTK